MNLVMLPKNCMIEILFVECGPGMFKWWVPTWDSPNSYRDQCVQCAPGRIKPVFGDSLLLCQEVCDGTTNVENYAHSACGEQKDKKFVANIGPTLCQLGSQSLFTLLVVNLSQNCKIQQLEIFHFLEKRLVRFTSDNPTHCSLLQNNLYSIRNVVKKDYWAFSSVYFKSALPATLP